MEIFDKLSAQQKRSNNTRACMREKEEDCTRVIWRVWEGRGEKQTEYTM